MIFRAPREQHLKGLLEPVTVLTDRHGVPHIFAQTLDDAFYAQGYCHGRDRLWQMDMNRRVASGWLAEAFGPRAVALDRFLRRIGLRRQAVADFAQLDQRERDLLQAHARGVNAAARRPFEMWLLGLPWRPWDPIDALVWVRMMAFDLSGNWQMELLRAELARRVGPDLAARLAMPHTAGMPITLGGLTAGQLPPLARDFAGLLGGGGSNCWAVSGSRSASGKPILANDPHLNMSLPSVWYENHLVAPGLDVYGVSLPGFPGVVLGHNRHLAWGVTNSCVDVIDLYEEQLDGDRVRTREGWEPLKLVDEVIRVRGRSPEVEQVQITRHGPMIFDCMALRWAGEAPAHMLRAVVDLNRATTVAEADEALRDWATPSLNVIMADREHIAYRLTGRVPIRARGSGLTPVPGWDGEHEWTGYIPFDEMPHVVDPPEGFLVSANASVAGPDYGHWLSWDFTSGTRALRIQEVIESRPRHSAADFRALQLDVRSPLVPRFQALCRELPLTDPLQRRALEMLLAWNGEVRAASPATALYEVWLQCLMEEVLEPRLGPELTELVLGRSRNPLGLVAEHGGRTQVSLIDALERGDPEFGDPAPLLSRALANALGRLGPDPAGWRWGKLHRLHLRHPLAALPLVGWLFRGPRLELDGDSDTPLQTHPILERGKLPRDCSWCPGWRHVVDFADPEHAWTDHAGGQSGALLSRHRLDGLYAWARGEGKTNWMEPAEIQANLD